MPALKEQYSYTQPSFEGLPTLEIEETELQNCLVLERPVYKDTDKKQEWTCVLHAQPSIFQPETDAVILATAQNNKALAARRKSLKPGDRAAITGIVKTHEVTFPNGTTQTINEMSVTHIHITKREKRVSTTVFEQKRFRCIR